MAKTLFIFLKDCPEIGNGEYVFISEQQATTVEAQQALEMAQEEAISVHIVLTAQWVTVHWLELPTLKKAELMIPNILEEQLASNIDDLHFVLDKDSQQQEHYLVYCVAQSLIESILEQTTQYHLQLKSITSEYLNLTNLALTISPEYAIINQPLSTGATSLQALEIATQALSTETALFTFKDSNPAILKQIKTSTNSLEVQQSNEPYSHTFVRQALLAPPYNLLQGQYKQKNKSAGIHKLLSWPLLATCAAAFITSAILSQQQLASQLDKLKQDNFKIYKQVFPSATQMISPRFRIEEQLKAAQQNGPSRFFNILNLAAPILHQQQGLILNSMNFQDDALTLNFDVDSFSALEQLEQNIAATNLTVKQQSATSKNNKVNAVWRLS